jgi:hypothetical protein
LRPSSGAGAAHPLPKMGDRFRASLRRHTLSKDAEFRGHVRTWSDVPVIMWPAGFFPGGDRVLEMRVAAIEVTGKIQVCCQLAPGA